MRLRTPIRIAWRAPNERIRAQPARGGNDVDPKDFLTLSTRVCNDIREWLTEVKSHHAITEDDLLTLTAAADIVDTVTVKLTTERRAPR
jgi:hypothetical protein